MIEPSISEVRAEKDPSRFYQDDPFPGRKLISCAVGILVIVSIIPSWLLNIDQLPPWFGDLQTALFIPAIPLYFIGFWKAVVGKGYPKILFLISFIPPIGLFILFFLPTKTEEKN